LALPKDRRRGAEKTPEMPDQVRLIKKAACRRDVAQRQGLALLCQQFARVAQVATDPIVRF
jgi:hypothetical protein